MIASRTRACANASRSVSGSSLSRPARRASSSASSTVSSGSPVAARTSSASNSDPATAASSSSRRARAGSRPACARDDVPEALPEGRPRRRPSVRAAPARERRTDSRRFGHAVHARFRGSGRVPVDASMTAATAASSSPCRFEPHDRPVALDMGKRIRQRVPGAQVDVASSSRAGAAGHVEAGSPDGEAEGESTDPPSAGRRGRARAAASPRAPRATRRPRRTSARGRPQGRSPARPGGPP